MMMIIDGPNFINKIMDYGVDNDFICKYLLLRKLPEVVSNEHNQSSGGLIEFVCSIKSFGPRSRRMSSEQTGFLLQRFMRERGVHVERLNIPSENDSEKGVDITIANLFEIYSDNHDDFVFVSEDRDYLPLLKRLRHKGKRVMLLTLSNNCPIEIINEAYGEINISQDIRLLFAEEEVTIPPGMLSKESLRHLVASKNNSYETRLIVLEDGSIGIEKRSDWHNPRIKRSLVLNDGVDGYVGPKAACNSAYIEELVPIAQDLVERDSLNSEKVSNLVKIKMPRF